MLMKFLAAALVAALLVKAYLVVDPASALFGNKIYGEVNVYSSRKEELVRDLFDKFTKESGIKVNFVRDKAAKLISRLQSEGKNTPADLFITSDVGNLEYASELGILAPIKSEILNANIPADYRKKDGTWFGLSLRLRAILYAKDRIVPEQLSTYEDLADPKWQGKILIRSSSNIYNQSLLASLIDANGLEKTEEWARGIVANFARKPQGGDTDQIKAIASGEGDIAIANSYYYGRLIASDKKSDNEIASKVGIFFPNQEGRGVHINISGAGVTKYAANKENAIKLLEFLSSQEAQKIYAERNHEYPVLSIVAKSDIVSAWGEFKKDRLPIDAITKYRSELLKIADRAGWR